MSNTESTIPDEMIKQENQPSKSNGMIENARTNGMNEITGTDEHGQLATLVKGVRQQFLLNTAGIKIPITKSILLHCAGYSLTLTPGGSGEFIKTYYLK